ncbi:MAG: Ger(x)C family spore germination protein [Firmicutes bacterium]|jgi:spore germination protein KC|nr:Ger(x)C family spore germination protein [Bacillota bacterium]MDH7494933.1 Ger(x)C family spore germination protein [Bacillota bacterium]
MALEVREEGRGPRLVRASLLLSILVVMALSSSGCWDRTEVDDVAFIMAIGLDDAPDDQVYATFHIAVPRAVAGAGGVGGGSGGGGAGQQSSLITTLMGRSVLSLLNLLSTHVDRRPSFVHGKMVVVGEKLAKRGIAPYIGEILRFRETRRTMFLAVVRGTAKEFIEKNRPVLEQNPAKNLELLALANKQAGFIPPSQVHRFLVEMQSLGEAPVTILAGMKEQAVGGRTEQSREDTPDDSSGSSGNASQTDEGNEQPKMPLIQAISHRSDSDYVAGQSPSVGGNPIEFLGGAVFRGDRMVGEITGQDVRAMLMLRGTFKRGVLDVEDPFVKGKYVSCGVRLARPTEIRVTREGGRFHVKVKVLLEGELIGTQSLVDYSDPKNLHTLERRVADDLTRSCQHLVKEAQETLRADIFAFGNKARHLVKTWEEWEALDWPEKFPEAVVDIDFRLALRRTGLLFKPPLPSTERKRSS